MWYWIPSEELREDKEVLLIASSVWAWQAHVNISERWKIVIATLLLTPLNNTVCNVLQFRLLTTTHFWYYISIYHGHSLLNPFWYTPIFTSTSLPVSSGIRQVYTPSSSAVRTSTPTRLLNRREPGWPEPPPNWLTLNTPEVFPMVKRFPSRSTSWPTPVSVDPERHWNKIR